MSFGQKLVELLRIGKLVELLKHIVKGRDLQEFPRSQIMAIWATLGARRFGKEWGDQSKIWSAIREGQNLSNARA